MPFSIRESDWRDSLQMQQKGNFIRGCIKFSHNRTAVIGLIMLSMLLIVTIFAPIVAPYPKDAGLVVHFKDRHLPPSLKHPFGTDGVGRDVLSRTIFGARISLSLAGIVLAISIPLGVFLGISAAYFMGLAEQNYRRVFRHPAHRICLGGQRGTGSKFTKLYIGNRIYLVERLLPAGLW